jgi:XTP/dITP diphosphohydrolase
MRLLVASKNQGKIREIKRISRGRIEIVSPLDIVLDADILEDGKTLRDNSLKKALTYFRKTNICTIGEDTGLFVEALGGKPGVYSARYGGGGDRSNREKLLTELKGEKNREAYFETVFALVISEQWIEFFEGKLSGKIAEEEIGDKGFGYDSIFFPDGDTRTFGQMSEEEKNNISHRKIALEKVFDYIEVKEEEIQSYCK